MEKHTSDHGTTIQTWPGGRSYTYRGDVHAPTIEVKTIETYDCTTWRTATAEEHRAIKINVLANIYADRDVLCCDSALVDDLIKVADEMPKELADAFGIDEIRNMYADPSDWGMQQCYDYLEANGIDLPYTGENPWTAFPDSLIETLTGAGVEFDADGPEDALRDALIAAMDDETVAGLDDWRDACRDYAQDNPAEVFEWWRVSSWLCAKLHETGEVTIDNGYGHWWGRTCTGQGFIMDGTLQNVAAQFVE